MRTPGQAALRLGVLACVVVAIIVLVVQAIQRPVSGSTTTYRADFGDVFGLKENTDVRLRGVQIGKVVDIAISENSRAIVEFTVLDEYRLRAPDRLAIKFQNLTGQRYLELERAAEDAPELDPRELVTHTVDSFDITIVFNGLKPLLREADPAVYNRLAMNVAAVIDGSEDSVTPVMRDIATLATYAEDRSALMSTILTNLQSLSDQLQGRSQNLENILKVFHSIFTPLVTRMGEFLDLVEKGALEMSEVGRTVNALARLGLGATDYKDEFTRRVSEVIPDPAIAMRTLSVLPGVFEGLNALIPNTDPQRQCGNGLLPLPITADVLLHGRQLVVCNGGA
ncbi:MlaD family protein [Nocardia shimofusensis]|uniref:MlaD family protein n=1 Tax=Nocardia shimofusensis TaxID=228596 RepID=UPI000835E96C|nr:MlaD family protein [Nocardia shimofusensis]